MKWSLTACRLPFISRAAAMGVVRIVFPETGAPKRARKPSPRYL